MPDVGQTANVADRVAHVLPKGAVLAQDPPLPVRKQEPC